MFKRDIVSNRIAVQNKKGFKIKCRQKHIFPSKSAIPIRSQRVVRVIFSSPTLDISPTGKGSSLRKYVRRSRSVKMARTKLSWTEHTYVTPPNTFALVHVAREMLAKTLLQFAARSALIGSSGQMLLAMGYTFDTGSVSIWNTRVCVRYQMFGDTRWKGYAVWGSEDIAKISGRNTWTTESKCHLKKSTPILRAWID